MWYWDYFPSGNIHPKKPLSRKQIQKMKEGYEKADMISAHIHKIEEQEQEKMKQKVEEQLNELFL